MFYSLYYAVNNMNSTHLFLSLNCKKYKKKVKNKFFLDDSLKKDFLLKNVFFGFASLIVVLTNIVILITPGIFLMQIFNIKMYWK